MKSDSLLFIMIARCTQIRSIKWLASVFLLWGCSGTPASTYYMLTSSEVTQNHSQKRFTHLEQSPLLGIGPIHISAHIDRPQLVSRVHTHRLLVHELHRWGSDLHAQLMTQIYDDFSRTVHPKGVIRYPWVRATRPQKQLIIHLHRLDGVLNDALLIDCSWKLIDVAQDSLLTQGRFRHSISIESQSGESDFDAYVRAMNIGVERFIETLNNQLGGVLRSAKNEE